MHADGTRTRRDGVTSSRGGWFLPLFDGFGVGKEAVLVHAKPSLRACRHFVKVLVAAGHDDDDDFDDGGWIVGFFGGPRVSGFDRPVQWISIFVLLLDVQTN